MEAERARAQAHEATAEQLKQRIVHLQELKLKEQLQHSGAIDKLLAELRDAHAKVAEVSEIRQKAENKYITAREFVFVWGGSGGAFWRAASLSRWFDQRGSRSQGQCQVAERRSTILSTTNTHTHTDIL